MNILLIVLALVAGSASAWGQAKTDDASDPAKAAVTFAELEGAVIETSVVLQQVNRREGSEFRVGGQSDLKLVIGPGDRIDGTLTHTALGRPGGARKGEIRPFSAQLGRPEETKLFGGGRAVWVFSEGTLTHLRTFKSGAFKRDITFTRTDEGFACTATEAYAREHGTGSIVYDSPIDGLPVTVVSAEQISSSCRVTRR